MDCKVSAFASAPPNADVGCSLSAYMQLPCTHYTLMPLPLGATLTRVAETESLFALSIPRVQLFNLAVKPTIRVCVSVASGLSQPCVLIRVVDSRVDGAWAEQLKLNERFEIWGTTQLTTSESGDSIVSVTDLRVGVDPPPPFSALPRRLLVQVGNAVLNAVCAALQRVFIRALAADYRAWATDAGYRERRARGELHPVVLILD
jgi:hypothetical protein